MIQNNTASAIRGTGASSTGSDNSSRIQAIQQQIRSLEQKIDEQQTELRQYMADQNEEGAESAQQLLNIYQQQLTSLNEELASLQREQSQTKISAPSQDASGRELPANTLDADALQQLRNKYDTFVPGFEDPATESSVIYSVEHSEDGAKITT